MKVKDLRRRLIGVPPHLEVVFIEGDEIQFRSEAKTDPIAEKRKRILELFADDNPIPVICRLVGCSKDLVNRVLRESEGE